jgi:hypothetical protein
MTDNDAYELRNILHLQEVSRPPAPSPSPNTLPTSTAFPPALRFCTTVWFILSRFLFLGTLGGIVATAIRLPNIVDAPLLIQTYLVSNAILSIALAWWMLDWHKHVSTGKTKGLILRGGLTVVIGLLLLVGCGSVVVVVATSTVKSVEPMLVAINVCSLFGGLLSMVMVVAGFVAVAQHGRYRSWRVSAFGYEP